MKTQKQVETKLQDLEAAILKKREEINVKDCPTKSDYYELNELAQQAIALKWCLQ